MKRVSSADDFDIAIALADTRTPSGKFTRG